MAEDVNALTREINPNEVIEPQEYTTSDDVQELGRRIHGVRKHLRPGSIISVEYSLS